MENIWLVGVQEELLVSEDRGAQCRRVGTKMGPVESSMRSIEHSARRHVERKITKRRPVGGKSTPWGGLGVVEAISLQKIRPVQSTNS